MKIFITGSTGFIGKEFITQLKNKLSDNDKVYCFTREKYDFKDERFENVLGDIKEIHKFKVEILDSDYFFHLAANATFGNDNDYDTTNFKPTKDIVDILKKSKKIKNFIFISTIGAFDRDKYDDCSKPLSINSKPNPRSEYGKSKLKSEEYIKNNKINYTIIRPTWVYGSNMRSNSHINQFVSMCYNKSLIVKFNFQGKVSIIHVKDLVKSMCNCISNNQVINKEYFAETESLSIGEIFKIINYKLNKKKLNHITIPKFNFIIKRIHNHLPLTVSNLFINYLCAYDERFRKDLLKDDKTITFEKGIDDVINTNIQVSGYWVITGANSGIGLSLAKKLDNLGKKLILIDKNIDIINKEFKKQIIIKANLSDFNQIVNAVEEINKHRLYCIINNAGIGYKKSFEQLTIEEIKRVISVNIEAHVYLTKLLLNKLIKENTTIVNIASSVAYNPLPNMLTYSSTKAFISNWSESLTYELRKTNKVITFSPSGTNTNFQNNAGVRKEKSGKGLLTPEYVADKIFKTVINKKTVVILDLKTNILLFISKFLPRKWNIILWGKLFEKMR